MCAGSAISSKSVASGFMSPSSYSKNYGYGSAGNDSPYSNNYGYGSAGNDSPFANEERQWYIDQGFGDPSEVVGKSGPSSGGFTTGPYYKRTYSRPTPGTPGYYKGVSREARYLYTQSSIPKTVYLQERAPSAASSLGVPASTRWAGNALTINPVPS